MVGSVPNEKNVPSIRPSLGPRSPTPCKVGCQQSRSGDRFTVAKKSFPSCSRQVCRQSQHCKGGGGRSWPWVVVGKCRGDVLFARDGKGIHSDHAGICAWRNFCTCPGDMSRSPFCHHHHLHASGSMCKVVSSTRHHFFWLPLSQLLLWWLY